MLLRGTLFFLLSLALFACAGGNGRNSKPHPPVATAHPAPPRSIGAVALVNEESHFVLIEAAAAPSPGTMLQVIDEGGQGIAVLRTSAENKHPFLIADIVSGTAHPGDRVQVQAEAPKPQPPSAR